MRLLPAAMTAIAVIWLVALFAAPASLSQRQFPFATLLVYEAGSRICHQRPERSFRWAGVQMPVCGRCLGLYVAGALGACAALLSGTRRRRAVAGPKALAAVAAPILLSVGFEWLNVVKGNNVARFVSGVPFGAVVAWTLIQMAKTQRSGNGRRDS